jgi:hypothetical protein
MARLATRSDIVCLLSSSSYREELINRLRENGVLVTFAHSLEGTEFLTRLRQLGVTPAVILSKRLSFFQKLRFFKEFKEFGFSSAMIFLPLFDFYEKIALCVEAKRLRASSELERLGFPPVVTFPFLSRLLGRVKRFVQPNQSSVFPGVVILPPRSTYPSYPLGIGDRGNDDDAFLILSVPKGCTKRVPSKLTFVVNDDRMIVPFEVKETFRRSMFGFPLTIREVRESIERKARRLT